MNMNDALTVPPRWLVMWCLAALLFFAGKAAVLIHHKGHRLTPARLAAFAFLWAGMDVRPWTQLRRPVLPGIRDLLPAFVKIAAGAVLLWGVARILPHPLAQGWCGMIGLVLLLHFGLFELLAVGWRAYGIPVASIMDRPTAATTVAEFWGRRWNRAFRDLTHPLLFRPVARHWGQHAAVWSTFLVSGLAHELVISLPAGAGYGLPTLYFLMQACGITVERKVPIPANTAPVRRWLFTHTFTVLPAIILFHPPFVCGVMLPFFNFLGALP